MKPFDLRSKAVFLALFWLAKGRVVREVCLFKGEIIKLSFS